MLFGGEMSLLRWHGRAGRYRRPITHSQLLCAGLLGYGILIALPASKYVDPTFGWIASVLLLATFGYLLRRNLWDEGHEALRFFGLSVLWLMVIAAMLALGGDGSEGSFLVQFSGLILMTFVPLWLPVGFGILIAEIQARKWRKEISRPQSGSSVETSGIEQGESPKP